MRKSYWRESADGMVMEIGQSDEPERLIGWRLVLAWAVVIGGSWAITIGILVWVLQ